MQIKILFDREAKSRNLRSGWGISYLVDDKILFDTGEKGEWLLHNMAQLNIDISQLLAVVISHLMDRDRRSIEIIVNKFKDMEIKKAGPSHCSGREAEELFRNKYGNNFITIEAGEVLDI